MNWNWLVGIVTICVYQRDFQKHIPNIAQGTLYYADPLLTAMQPLSEREWRHHTWDMGGVLLNSPEVECSPVLWQRREP